VSTPVYYSSQDNSSLPYISSRTSSKYRFHAWCNDDDPDDHDPGDDNPDNEDPDNDDLDDQSSARRTADLGPTTLLTSNAVVWPIIA